MERLKDRKNSKQIKHLEFIANMSDWEYTVYDAFHTRMRLSTLSNNSEAKKAYDYFLENPHNEVAQLLASEDLHGWRPTGITIFAKLIEIDKSRDDNAVSEAIQKAATIGKIQFQTEYLTYAFCKSVSPKLILETVLKEDHNISLETTAIDTTTVYDGLRKNDSKTAS